MAATEKYQFLTVSLPVSLKTRSWVFPAIGHPTICSFTRASSSLSGIGAVPSSLSLAPGTVPRCHSRAIRSPLCPSRTDRPPDYETFADGFAGLEPIPDRGAADYRPPGLAMGTAGGPPLSDHKKVRTPRLMYTGKGEPP